MWCHGLPRSSWPFNSIEWIRREMALFQRLSLRFQFHWMDSSKMFASVDDLRHNITFNSIEWIPRIYQLAQIQQYIVFQFHWMDSNILQSRRGTWWWSCAFNSIEWILDVHRLPAGYGNDLLFQFHWMDSYPAYYVFRVYGPDDRELEDFQFHWMDSLHYQADS